MNNRNRKEYQKHLTLSDRIYIEQGLLQKMSFKEIASFLYKDPSTISKEVRRAAETSSRVVRRCEICHYYKVCTKHHVCNDTDCSRRCKACYKKDVVEICETFTPYQCDKYYKPPYVCNGCDNRRDCPLVKLIYDAKHAQRQYEKRLSESRRNISLTVEELSALDELITPLVQKGQPLSHIFATHKDEIPC